ncbi:5030_t:CDS:2, partial [Diversispora eburnea]
IYHAFEWYKKAAENDDADGQYRLGKCFYEGYGTKKDIVNAVYCTFPGFRFFWLYYLGHMYEIAKE